MPVSYNIVVLLCCYCKTLYPPGKVLVRNYTDRLHVLCMGVVMYTGMLHKTRNVSFLAVYVSVSIQIQHPTT